MRKEIEIMPTKDGEEMDAWWLVLNEVDGQEFENIKQDSRTFNVEPIREFITDSYLNFYGNKIKEINFEMDKYDYYHISQHESKRVNASWIIRVVKEARA